MGSRVFLEGKKLNLLAEFQNATETLRCHGSKVVIKEEDLKYKSRGRERW